MTFLLGLAIGMVVGACGGLLVFALCHAASAGDAHLEHLAGAERRVS